MSTIQLLADSLEQMGQLLAMTTADFSPAEFFSRPCDGANHTAWQIGHLLGVEHRMGSYIKPGSMPELPADFGAKFTKETARLNDPAAFPAGPELVRLLLAQRAAFVQLVRTLSEQDLQRPAPENMRGLAPTVGRMITLQIGHTGMHIGQMQVARRKCGKPVQF